MHLLKRRKRVSFRTSRRAHAYLNDLQHLHACDFPISIQIVHVEGPVEFLLEAAPGGDGQGTDELPEVDGPVAVLVERSKCVLGELGGIAVGEKLKSENKVTSCKGRGTSEKKWSLILNLPRKQ